jgi:hypothetical protein
MYFSSDTIEGISPDRFQTSHKPRPDETSNDFKGLFTTTVTAVNLIGWNGTEITSLPACQLALIIDTDDGSSTFLRNISKVIPDCTVTLRSTHEIRVIPTKNSDNFQKIPLTELY